MKWLFRPTLVRRVVLSLLLTVALAWLAIMVYGYVDLRSSFKSNTGLLNWGNALNDVLSSVEREDVAVAIVQATSQQYNQVRSKDASLPARFLFRLCDRQGRELFSSEPMPWQSLQGQPGRIVEVALGEKPYWLFEGRSARWKVWMLEPGLSTTTMLALIGGSLVVPFLIAIPCIFLPVWWVVFRGLQPLRSLGERIRSRKIEDLSALGFNPKYDELAPLVEALDGLLSQLRAKVERERAFVQDAAHELRTPLAVIRTQAHNLARATANPEAHESVAHLDHAVERGSRLVQQLLDLATLDAGEARASQEVDLAELARLHIAQSMSQAMERQVEIAFESPDVLTASLHPACFEAILRNLLDNAIKYCGRPGRVKVFLQRGQARLTLGVSDTGPGIEPQERNRVFERFYRGTAAANTTGSGLGLSIVQQACERLSATISLTPNPLGKGCLFEVAIPIGAPSIRSP